MEYDRYIVKYHLLALEFEDLDEDIYHPVQFKLEMNLDFGNFLRKFDSGGTP